MKTRRISQRVLLSLVVLLFGATSAYSGEEKDSFDQELDSLRQQTAPPLWKGPLIQAYEKFIAKYAKEPRVNKAMIDLASVYTAEDPKIGTKADYESGFKWIRRAAETATPGSKDWFQNQQYLRSTNIDTAEKRTIIESMSCHAMHNLAIQAQIEKDMMDVCVLEKKYDDAEVHCRRIMDWYNDPARVPSDSLMKSEIDRLIWMAGNEFVLRLAESPFPKAERKKRIEQLVQRYPYNQDVYFNTLDLALEHSEGRWERK